MIFIDFADIGYDGRGNQKWISLSKKKGKVVESVN